METAPYHEERLIKGLRRFTFTRHRRPVFRCFPPSIFRPFRHETPTFRHTGSSLSLSLSLSLSPSLSLSLPVVVKVRYPVGDALSELPIVQADRCWWAVCQVVDLESLGKLGFPRLGFWEASVRKGFIDTLRCSSLDWSWFSDVKFWSLEYQYESTAHSYAKIILAMAQEKKKKTKKKLT